MAEMDMAAMRQEHEAAPDRLQPLDQAHEFLRFAQQNMELMQEISIIVPLRSTDGVDPVLAKMLSVWTLVGIQWGDMIDYGGGFIECTRANISRQFRDHNQRKYLLMIDNDMVPDVWLPYQLVRHEAPVVGCCAMSIGKEGPQLCLTRKDVNGDYRFPLMSPTAVMPARGLVEVGHVGTGAMMIRRDVLEAFEFVPGDTPFYVDEKIRQRGHATGTLKRGEDIEFCSQVRKKGFKIYADLEAHVGHKKQITLYWEAGKEEMNPEDWVLPAEGLKIRGD